MTPTFAANAARQLDTPISSPGNGGVAHPQSSLKKSQLSPELADRISHWLEWQCCMLSGVRGGTVFLESNSKPQVLDYAGSWPNSGAPDERLWQAANEAFKQRRSTVQKAAQGGAGQNEVFDHIAYPLVHDKHVFGAVSMTMEKRTEAQRQTIMQLLGWGVRWLESLLKDIGTVGSDGSPIVLDAVALASSDRPLPVVCYELCGLLAERMQCERVVLGISKGLRVPVVAMSHQLQFDRRDARVVEFEAVMEECLQQEQAVCVPAAQEGELIAHAHNKLLERGDYGAVCSIPLIIDAKPLGAIVFGRAPGEHFTQETLASVEELMGRLTGVIDLQCRENQAGWQRLKKSAHLGFKRLLGPSHFTFKMTALVLVTLFAGLLFINTEHRVAATASIEGITQRVVSAPFDGIVMEAPVRSGDQVVEQQMLAIMDDREMQLERDKLKSEFDKVQREYVEALADGDRSKVSVASAQVEQARARMSLLDYQLERTRVRAPFDGTIINGDLSRSLGAPVERGQVLFELAPDGDFRLALAVDEHDIGHLEVGQTGRLRLTGLPNKAIAIQVERIVPLTSDADGGNRFRVEAKIAQMPEGVRPGMQGVAKIDVGKGSLISVWTRSLVQRLRLWFWSAGL